MEATGRGAKICTSMTSWFSMSKDQLHCIRPTLSQPRKSITTSVDQGKHLPAGLGLFPVRLKIDPSCTCTRQNSALLPSCLRIPSVDGELYASSALEVCTLRPAETYGVEFMSAQRRISYSLNSCVDHGEASIIHHSGFKVEIKVRRACSICRQ
jgi:hypothetical protein